MKLYANFSLWYLRSFNAAFAAETAPGMLVLDARAGSAPYRNRLAHSRYETADFWKIDKPYAEISVVCGFRRPPVEDAHFNCIVFNPVMEHVPDPLAVLKELHGVLKPGVRIICSAPLAFDEHEQPYDFYRYTQFAHRYLFESAGLAIERITWLAGYFGTLAYQCRLTQTGLFTAILSRLARVIRIEDRGAPVDYLVLASKAAETGEQVGYGAPDNQ